MENVFEIQGYWWITDSPENRVAGTVYFDLFKETTLKLIGGFHPPVEFLQESHKNNNSINIIHGEESNSEEITLINCSLSGSVTTIVTEHISRHNKRKLG